MLSSARKFNQIAQLTAFFFLNLSKQKKYIRAALLPAIEEIKTLQDATLGEQDFRKITSYYGLAVPAVLGDGFSLLRGKKMSEQERYQLTYMGALTGLFDDFFDKLNTPEEHIRTLINAPDEKIAQNAHELLFVRFYTRVLEFGNATQVKQQFHEVFAAQLASLKQKNPSLDQDTIRRITLKKGGTSLLFYRSVLENPPTAKEQAMLYYLGGVGQLENDIFDVYKDYTDGIYTLATTTTDIHPLRVEYSHMLRQLFRLVEQTDYPAKNRQRFAHYIALIVSRGLVCLEFLAENQLRTNDIFMLSAYSRAELICDMEKITNLKKHMRHYLALSI